MRQGENGCSAFISRVLYHMLTYLSIPFLQKKSNIFQHFSLFRTHRYDSPLFRKTKQRRQSYYAPFLSYVARFCKNVIRNLHKNYHLGIWNNLLLGVFDENYRRYSSILILYKLQILVYNIRADKPVSPRPDMPASFLAQYFVSAKYQAHDIPPCGGGHCCASFILKDNCI